ncbi:unnamed protein product, partial [Rotaria sp. Silwood1]
RELDEERWSWDQLKLSYTYLRCDLANVTTE